jgi:DNA repair exonuclease SbcCD ATPase subunit
MGETAEFEKLNTLEARLAAALDRIAMGLGRVTAPAPLDDPGLTTAAFEDALIRAQRAEARVRELEAQLADAAAQAAQMGDLAALSAERDEIAGTVATQQDEIARLQAALAEAKAAPLAAAPAIDTAPFEARIDDLEARLVRLRAERAEAIAERDEARDIAEELQAAAGHHPEDRAMTLRAEIKELQVINERLIKNINRLRGENATDPGVLNKALVVELDAMRVMRASEAAELERILADLDGAAAGEGADA